MTYHLVSLGLHALLVAHGCVDLCQSLLVPPNNLLSPATQVLWGLSG